MIKYIVNGNIFNSECQTLVNTVNCVGVMGKGVAKQFKQHYPAVFAKYEQQCKAGEWKPGSIYPHKLEDDRIILNASTKDHWKPDSQIEWINSIIFKILLKWQQYGITSIAMTKLGCGNGNLDWSEVGPRMAAAFRKLPIPVEIYIDPGDEQF